MPARDGTGPSGMGAGTGRGMGHCAGDRKLVSGQAMAARSTSPGWGRQFWNMTFGRAFRRRVNRGGGFGRRSS